MFARPESWLRRPGRIVACVVLGISIGAVRARAQTLEESVVRYVEPYVEVGDFAGVVLLADAEGVVFERAFGRTGRPPRAPRSLDASYRIGSVSKQFTAAAVLLLAESGDLALDEPLARWFPDLENLRAVTPHELLTHTAGLSDVYELPSFPELNQSGADLEELVEAIAREKPHFAPGSSYAYSNGNYIVLARLIELASGQPFETYLRERVFRPLGLENIGSEPSSGPVAGEAPPYDPAGRDGVRPAAALDLRVVRGAGSLYASARDLYGWLRALYEGELLAGESWSAMTTDHGNGYGYGLSVYERGGRPVVGHDGRGAGGIADVTLFLDDGSVIVVVGNVQSGVADEFRRDLSRLLARSNAPTPRLRERRDAPRPRPGTGWQPSGEELARWAGDYRFHPSLVVHVRASEGRLLARANEGVETELVPMERGVFFSRTLYANVEFEAGEEGRRMIWNEAGNRWVGRLE
jgi:CubicO group peptidase (beta-lactamase class C family)